MKSIPSPETPGPRSGRSAPRSPIGGWNPECSSRRVGSLVRTDALQFSPQPSPRLLPASSPPPGETRPFGVRFPALLLAQGIGGDAQALHQFADRIPQIYPSFPPSCDTDCFRSRIAFFLDTDTIDIGLIGEVDLPLSDFD